jgi:hypothetical protein
VREKHPFDGPLVLSVDGEDRTIGRTVATQVFVQRATNGDGDEEPAASASSPSS